MGNRLGLFPAVLVAFGAGITLYFTAAREPVLPVAIGTAAALCLADSLRVRVGIVRAVRRLATTLDANAVPPWLDVATFPHAAASSFGLLLYGAVFAF